MSLKDSTKQEIVAHLKRIYDSPAWHQKEKLKTYIEKLEKEYIPQQRTNSQNASLHLLFQLTANALNDGGFSVQKVLEHKSVDIPWSLESVKELLWRPVQIAVTNKESTTELDKTEERDLIYDVLNRHLSEKIGLSLPEFPHNEY